MPVRDRSLTDDRRGSRPRWDDPVEVLRGIGPKTAAALGEHGVYRVLDLLLHVPRRYQDRGSITSVADAIDASGPVLVRGELVASSSRYVRRRMHITDGELVDASGRMPVRWFNQPWIAERLGDGLSATVFGRVAEDRTGRRRLVNPEIEIETGETGDEDLQPIYPPLGPLRGRRLRRTLDDALRAAAEAPDPIPVSVRRRLAVPSLADALAAVHRPDLPDDPDRRASAIGTLERRATPAYRRLAFDELLSVSLVVEDARRQRRRTSTRPIAPLAEPEGRAQELLGFRLTGAQGRVLSEIVRDLGGTTPMARLLQGDVGSGKTAVAAMALLTAVEDGRQAALMAPTELLAEQLHRVVSAPLESAGFEVRLLTGSTAAGEARAILTGLEEGDVDVVVGTHALFQERIGFADLGLVVIDEQHRFGVAQRQRLVDKGDAPHLLVMTATPIPRSLALTLYGDLDLSLIDELPPGRSPVRTVVRPPEARSKIFRFLRSEIAQGGQVYIVYPMIEGSGSIEAAALENDVEEVKACLPGVKVGILHGRMDRAEREAAAGAFRRRELQVLLATTVIEVGVDVPSASVMLVESADRFGLSQLHQLRGRVGRGERRSWCILVAGAGLSDAAVRRLAVLERTTDGFEIAEADLLHRGPGELTGLRQWGAEGFRFADLARDRRLLSDARETAKRLGDAGELERVRDALLSFHPIGGRFAIG